MDTVVMAIAAMETTSMDITAMDGIIMHLGTILITEITTESKLRLTHTLETMEEV